MAEADPGLDICEWTLLELLNLITSTIYHGDFQWKNISKTLGTMMEKDWACRQKRTNPSSFYSSKNCAVIYEKLLEKYTSVSQKRESRSDRTSSASPLDIIRTALVAERIRELKETMDKTAELYRFGKDLLDSPISEELMKKAVDEYKSKRGTEKLLVTVQRIQNQVNYTAGPLSTAPVQHTAEPDTAETVKPCGVLHKPSRSLKVTKRFQEYLAEQQRRSQRKASTHATHSTPPVQPPASEGYKLVKAARFRRFPYKDSESLTKWRESKRLRTSSPSSPSTHVAAFGHHEDLDCTDMTHTGSCAVTTDVDDIMKMARHNKRVPAYTPRTGLRHQTAHDTTRTAAGDHNLRNGGKTEVPAVAKSDRSAPQTSLHHRIARPGAEDIADGGALDDSGTDLSGNGAGLPYHRSRHRDSPLPVSMVVQSLFADSQDESGGDEEEEQEEDENSRSGSLVLDDLSKDRLTSPSTYLSHLSLQSWPSSISPCVSAPGRLDEADSDKAQKAWKKSIMLVWKAASSHKHASIFMHPVREEEVPGYHALIKNPSNLAAIKKGIETGTIRNIHDFQKQMLVMFQNAVMFNQSTHNIYSRTIVMRDEVVDAIQSYVTTQMMLQSTEMESKTLRGHKIDVTVSKKL